MRITDPLDIFVTMFVIAVGSANIIVLDMSPLANITQLIFILISAVRVGYTMAYNKLLGE